VFKSMAHLIRNKRIKGCFKEQINEKVLGISEVYENPETKWSIRRLIATYNKKGYPIVTWVVAKK